MSKIKIEISECLKRRLEDVGDKVSKLIIKLSEGVDMENLSKNFPNFLDFDGNLITYINSNSVEKNNIKDPWVNTTRQSTKAVRVIRRILTKEYVLENLTEQDIETFVANWSASLQNTATIIEYRGWDILKAFNYNKELSNKFQTSCANFNNPKNGYDEPMIKWFYFYIYNPNVSCAVIRENGIIKGRSVIFRGIQESDSGDYKKGVEYTYMNGLYTEGNSKYQSMLKIWGKERGYIMENLNLSNNKYMSGTLIIPIKTHYKTYPPVDNIYVDITKGLMVTREYEYRDGTLKRAYKLCQNGGKHLS